MTTCQGLQFQSVPPGTGGTYRFARLLVRELSATGRIFFLLLQVLTMEYVPGIKINRIKQLDQLGVDRKRLCNLKFLSRDQYKKHPGNIAVDDANGGRLIFYDFGMMGRLSLELLLSLHTSWKEIILLKCSYLSNKFHSTNLCSISSNIREGLLETFYGIYEKDPDRVIQVKEREMATTELGFKKPLTKEERLEKKKQRLAAIGETYDVSIFRV
ncbi:hypothetical protein GW17_00009176 [Ensete ventricosum]|nr:hypothetical protein GW17_00009176 [Ensete ventricosum]